jgi:1,4-dihydroxy-2-naphthoate octaprenyltransferase
VIRNQTEEQFKAHVTAWLRIARLHFYPMTFIAYSLGASLAAGEASAFDTARFWLGYAFLFLLELCTILANELYDLPTDRINTNASAFNGGSRVLVEKKLTPEAVRRVLFLLMCGLVFIAFSILLISGTFSRIRIGFLLLAGVIMGLGYTTPPLRFGYRGMGELIVAVTHSPFVIIWGFILQAGSIWDPMPWVISTPLFFAVLAAITLAGVPDWRADKTVGKKTLSVLMGRKKACVLAILFATIAVAEAGIIPQYPALEHGQGWAYWLSFITIAHWFFLILSIAYLIKSAHYDRTINGIMQLALGYIVWFGIIPLIGCLQT